MYLEQQSKNVEQVNHTKFIEALKDLALKLKLPFDIESFIKENLLFIRTESKKRAEGFLAEVHGDKIKIDSVTLDAMFHEMKDASESESVAYTGFALRMILVLAHERTHLVDRQAQIKELGFSWPLSSLHAEYRAVEEEARIYGKISEHPELLEILSRTLPPRNYILPGMSGSITEEFDRRVQSAWLLLKRKDSEGFTSYIKNYYPNAVDTDTQSRQSLVMQLTALRKVITDPDERSELEEALTICESPEKYERLLMWYKKRSQ